MCIHLIGLQLNLLTISSGFEENFFRGIFHRKCARRNQSHPLCGGNNHSGIGRKAQKAEHTGSLFAAIHLTCSQGKRFSLEWEWLVAFRLVNISIDKIAIGCAFNGTQHRFPIFFVQHKPARIKRFHNFHLRFFVPLRAICFIGHHKQQSDIVCLPSFHRYLALLTLSIRHIIVHIIR